MNLRLLPLFLLLFGFAQLTLAAGEEELAQEHLKVMERFLEIVGSLKDVASAKQAQPELTALSERNDGIFRKAKSLNIANDTMVKYLQAHYKARSAAIFEGSFTMMFTMSKLPEFEKMGDYLSKPVNALTNTTWASITN
jgi:hypothetical protein